MRKGIFALALAVVAALTMAAKGCSSTSNSSGGTTAATVSPAPPTAATAAPPTVATTAAPPTTPAPTTVPERHVTGTAATLGAGSFAVGRDVAAGLYDVTAGPGQSGNFIVQGTDIYDEILGANGIDGVPKVRAQLSADDTIQISGLARVVFTPVTAALITHQTPVNLYAGTWTVGQDLGPGRYVATPGTGQSGNFIIENEAVDEILGGSDGVPNVTFNVHDGDVITISSLSQVALTPA